MTDKASLHSEQNQKTDEEDEVFLTACDLTEPTRVPLTQIKGCIMKNATITEEPDPLESSEQVQEERMSFWKKWFCCRPCLDSCMDSMWILAVRGAKLTPESCRTNTCCFFIDKVCNCSFSILMFFFFVLMLVAVSQLPRF